MGLVTASGDQTASRPSLGDLRRMVARIERPTSAQPSRPALPFAVDAIDAWLPARGLALGAVHELAGTGPDTETAAAPALFAASILARRPGPVIWIIQRGGVFGHGLLQAGLDPRRVVLVDAGGQRCRSWRRRCASRAWPAWSVRPRARSAWWLRAACNSPPRGRERSACSSAAAAASTTPRCRSPRRR